MSFLDRIRACSVFDARHYLPFRVGKVGVGLVKAASAEALASFPEIFRVCPDGVDLDARLRSGEERTEAVAQALRELYRQGLVQGWRDEPYPVAERPAAPALMLIERAAVPLFGVYGAGVHINGYVGRGHDMRMWIGRRSLDKPTAPGKLDQIVAGGKSAYHSIRDTLLKESAEEANIPADVAKRACSVGAITYCSERPEGLRRDVLYNFDLELPSDFVPENTDGEINEFYLWPIKHVIEIVRDTDEFKFNCALVVIDFVIRHGFLSQDDPEYLDLIRGLHAF